MTSASDSDAVPQTGFDPVSFWYAHKKKVILYAVLVVAAALIFAIYEISSMGKIDDARLALASATSADDYRNIIEKYPGTIPAGNASLLLAENLRDAQKYDDAISVLHAMIDHQPKHPLIDSAWLSLASTYVLDKNPEQAIQTYQTIAQNFPDRYSAPLALFSIAEILRDEGKTDEAMVAYEKVQSDFPKSFFATEALQKLQSLKK